MNAKGKGRLAEAPPETQTTPSLCHGRAQDASPPWPTRAALAALPPPTLNRTRLLRNRTAWRLLGLCAELREIRRRRQEAP